MELASKIWGYLSNTGCFLIANPLGRKPSERDVKKIENLYSEMMTPYSDENHQWMLQSLFSLAHLHGRYERQGHCWKSLGFQREDPVSDLRGCGVLGLKNLIYMLTSESEKSLAMIERRRGREMGINYPWATAGVNVTRMIAECFELIRPYGLRVEVFSKKTYWSMLNEENAFDRLYTCAFVLLDSVYDEIHAAYMDFPKAVELTKARFQIILESSSSVSDIEFKLLGKSQTLAEGSEMV